MTEGSDKVGRVLRRIETHARGAAAHLAAMGSPRYPGGVDAIDIDRDDAVVVTGWVRTPGRSRLTSVVVFVDDQPSAVGHPHPGDPRTGRHVAPWRAEVSLPPGRTVMVHAVALCSNGMAVRFDAQRVKVPEPVPATPTDGHALGKIDLPVPDAVVDRPLLTIAGWALVDPVARIEVGIDGSMSPARQMAVPRPDVMRGHDSVHAGVCGFEHVLDISKCRAGERITIVAEAIEPTGAREVIARTPVTVGADVAAEPFDPEAIAVLRARTDRVVRRHQPAEQGIHLVVVTHDLGLGGGQLYLHELLLRLLETPDVRFLVVSPRDGPLRQELEERGVDVHICRPFATAPAAHESFLRELADVAREFEATAVVANTAGAVGGVELAERLGIPALWAIHESYAPQHFLLAAYGPGGAHPSAQGRLESALASASAVIFEADATRQLYCASGDPRRFVHIPYGIPLAEIDSFLATDDCGARRTRLGLTDDEVVILCVGTFEPRKAQASLLRAFAGLSGDHPEAVLVLVGDRGDPYGDAMRGYAEALDLGDRLRVEPVTPDLFGWYAMADVFVLASDVESLPRSVLEAMAFGVPSLVADVFGLGEIIEDGDNGLLVEPRDLAALEAGLRGVLSMTPEARRAMGERGARYVRARHDSRGYASDYRALLDGFAKDPTAFPEDFLER